MTARAASQTPRSGGHVLAVIGGSGLYRLEGLEGVEELGVDTPFGPPSDRVIRGRLGNTTLLFLARHGRGHRIAPHCIDYRANVCALKMLGATHLVSISAVGSMREEIAPGDFVVVDQFVDLTRKRCSTFFEDGIVAHVGFSDPVCPHLAGALAEAAERADARVHRGGTYVCIDGPQFSTRAESRLYRSWGISVIGMTALPEAKLAREAELPYALLALATDYDCWREDGPEVTVNAVLAVMQRNVERACRTIVEIARKLPDPRESAATGSLRGAIMTAKGAIPESARARLDWLVARYLDEST
ncbi:MAG TPA: S-methyl-5'-thioadenosine phosphorylase [Polyangiaceae bacterium]|nr:S-methyl-5'-thioadenosine phosphorylase [Polyangiaceae bacterium]